MCYILETIGLIILAIIGAIVVMFFTGVVVMGIAMMIDYITDMIHRRRQE